MQYTSESEYIGVPILILVVAYAYGLICLNRELAHMATLAKLGNTGLQSGPKDVLRNVLVGFVMDKLLYLRTIIRGLKLFDRQLKQQKHHEVSNYALGHHIHKYKKY